MRLLPVINRHQGFKQKSLLIAKPVLGAAVRAVPGDAVAGHSPEIFIHAFLADGKPAPAGPAERGCYCTAMADPVYSPAPAFATLLKIICCFS